MKRLHALVFALALILPAAGVTAGDHDSLEQLVVESADTPQEHEALARYYGDKAEHMRKMAENHRAMGQAYGGTKITQRKRMQDHCSALVADFEKAAGDFEALAKEHAEAAKP
jgi:hypothetical protein